MQGTAAEPVVFTSIHDDDFGGPDADATAPQPGDWLGLRFQSNSDASVVDHALIRYAGAAGTASVILDQADVTLCNVHIEFGAGAGLDTGGNSAPTLKNVSIDDNAGDPIQGITWNVLGNMSGVTAMGNGSAFDTVIIDSPVVVGEVTIEQENVFGPCIVVMVTPNTSSVNRLSFGRGLVVKAGLPSVALHAYEVHGTGLEKTVFTSIYDDEYGGDTNGDGGATLPLPGDWIGMRASVNQSFVVTPSQTVEHALIRYAGAPQVNVAPVALQARDVVSTRVEFSAADGIVADDGLNVIAFANAGTGLRAAFNARNCTAVLNGELGIRAGLSIYCIAWHNGPTLNENFFEVAGPIIGCRDCLARIVYCIGSDLGVSQPVQGAPGFFGCPNTGWGNVIADPLFVDESGGDLRLAGNSPALDYFLAPCPPSILNDPGLCTPWGQGTSLGYPSAPAHSRDHLENPRRVKTTLTAGGPWRADLGALERVNWTLEPLGGSTLGEPLSLRVVGPAGSASLVVGLPLDSEQVDDLYVFDYGYLMLNPLFLLFLPPVPVGFVVDLPIPDDPSLLGVEVGLQAVVSPTGQPTIQQLTNLYRPRLHN